jgi:nicotinate-nucleotide pyrophosphorylase (carboxylating)
LRPSRAPDLGRLAPLIRAALSEDVGCGDATSCALIPAGTQARGAIVARSSGVLAGVSVAAAVFRSASRRIAVRLLVADGTRVPENTKVALLHGPLRGILAGERVALNFLARLSGIATITRSFVQVVRPFGVAVLDTRKTTPMLRALEKYAVRAGGGRNHRFGLYDAILIKDNHLAAVADPVLAVTRARAHSRKLPVEIETQSLAQVRQAIAARPDVIMLDNMTIEQMRRAIQLIRRRRGIRIEISGGVTLGNVGLIARLRPDSISVGRLTHSAPAMDFSLDVESSPRLAR